MKTSPHSRFEHLFVVVRIDDFSVAARIEDRLSHVSAYHSQADAEEEAGRLNRLNEAKHCHYFVALTRLKK